MSFAKLDERRLRVWAPLLIFAIALILRILSILITAEYKHVFPVEMEFVARSLAVNHTFADPYIIPTGPTAHVMPAYALILAGIMTVFKSSSSSALVIHVVSCAVASLLYALLPFAAESFGMSYFTGIIAGLLGAILPFRLHNETRGDWEAPWTAVFLVLLASLTVKAWRNGAFERQGARIRALGWGLSALFAATTLSTFAATLAVGWKFRGRLTPRQYVTECLLSAMIVLLVLAPWTIRNEIVFSHLIMTRTNLGLELFVNNNDLASPTEQVARPRWHPSFSKEEALEVRRLGEPDYNRLRMQWALAWIRSHPLRFAALTLGRIKEFWFYSKEGLFRSLPADIITVIGFAGLWVDRRTHEHAVIFCLATIVAYPVIYYLTFVEPRYRYPLDWIFVLFGVHATLQMTLSIFPRWFDVISRKVSDRPAAMRVA